MSQGDLHRVLPALLVVVLLAALPSCRGPEEAPRETARAPDGALTSAEVEALETRAAVERLLRAGDHAAALSVADRALETLPPGPHRAAVRRMRQVAWDEHVRRDLVRASVRFDETRVTVGEEIHGAWVLENRSGETLVLSAEALSTEGGGARDVRSRTRFHLEMRFVEHHIGGTLASETWTEVRGLEEDVRLEPGEGHAFPIRLPSDTFSPASINYRFYEVGVRLHPARLTIGRERSAVPLVFEKARVEVFPRNWEHLAMDPLGRLDEALEKDSAVHVPLAAALVGEPHRSAAVDRLLEVLEIPEHRPPSPTVRTAACVALRILTGEERPARPEAWRKWSRAR